MLYLHGMTVAKKGNQENLPNDLTKILKKIEKSNYFKEDVDNNEIDRFEIRYGNTSMSC